MNPLASVSASSKHAADAVTLGSFAAAWMVDHTSLFTAIAAFLTIFWIALRSVESLQRIYFNWRGGKIVGDGE
jgi:hypothetical protein